MRSDTRTPTATNTPTASHTPIATLSGSDTPTPSPTPTEPPQGTVVIDYTYDDANRLTSVNGVPYSWDAKGNLLWDGVSTYTYDHANRLTGVGQGSDTYAFAYNGLGDRLRQTVNGVTVDYTIDINRGLIQVLTDGSNTYLYGLGRVGEQQPADRQYHHGDALGSVRQLTDAAATVTATRYYEPFSLTAVLTRAVSDQGASCHQPTDTGGRMHPNRRPKRAQLSLH